MFSKNFGGGHGPFAPPLATPMAKVPPPTPMLTAITSHSLAASPAKTTTFNSHMQRSAYNYLKLTFVDLLACYFYAVKTNDKAIRLPVSQPASTGKGANMSEMQAHHCMKAE